MPKNTPNVPLTWARARSHSAGLATILRTTGRNPTTIRHEPSTKPPTNNGSVIHRLVS